MLKVKECPEDGAAKDIAKKQRNRAAVQQRLQQTFELSADSAAPTPQYSENLGFSILRLTGDDQKLIRHAKTSPT